jgi:hypothetical protein
MGVLSESQRPAVNGSKKGPHDGEGGIFRPERPEYGSDDKGSDGKNPVCGGGTVI